MVSSSLVALLQGFGLGGGQIVAIGAQNAYVLRQGLRREFALSGSEQNPDLTGKSIRLVLGRAIGKRDMRLNDYLPRMQIDAQTYEVRADGVLLTCEPAKVLPMAQRYFLF